MKNLFLAYILLASPVYALDSKNQDYNLLKEDSDTINKYALVGVLSEMLQQKENLNNKKLNDDTKKIILFLKTHSLKETNENLSGSLTTLIKVIETISFTNQEQYIKYVIIGKTILK